MIHALVYHLLFCYNVLLNYSKAQSRLDDYILINHKNDYVTQCIDRIENCYMYLIFYL